MVGIGGDDITPDVPDDWPWFCDAVEEIVKYTRTPPAALEHILDQLHWRWTRWRYAKLEYEFIRAGPIPDYHIRLPPFFWRRYIFVKHDVDAANNCAVRTGAGIVDIRLDAKGIEEPVFNSRNLLIMRAMAIRLYRPDYMRGLQRIGLISPLTLVPVTQPSESPVKVQPELKWNPNDPNAWTSPETVASNLGLGWPRKPMRAVIEACRKLPGRPEYNGKGVAEVLVPMEPADLRKIVKCKSSDTCRRLLVALKAWCEQYPDSLTPHNSPHNSPPAA
jgi:hypothetical protein